jgi:cell migration-inducing and hyaluronan-binding protein
VPTWGEGDHIVVTTTDYLPGHTEEFVIKDVTSDATGVRIDLDTSLPSPMNAVQFPHWGEAYDYRAIAEENPGIGPAPDPNLPADQAGHVETRAIVALLSRSIRIASEGATPVIPRSPAEDHFPESEGNFYGGATVVREGFATYQVQGVEFYQLGQGGAIGRYPVHFHMARSVPQPDPSESSLGTYVADSSVVDSMNRFITVHATQGVTLARNVGYKSIGHGFYLEDATETNNRLYSNVGISVRGALDDKFTNPRKVPGILDLYAPSGQSPIFPNPAVPANTQGSQMPDAFPYYSDVNNPTVFWIENTWNDFQYNAAVGAGMCGACYWMPPAGISGPSQYETWKSYASLQKNPIFFGAAPLMTFKGNSCSTAMNSLMTVGGTAQCNGAYFGQGTSTDDQLYSVVNPNAPPAEAFPKESGQRQRTTVCNSSGDCSATPHCDGRGDNLAYCLPFVIDHYTTSFNWAQTNFAAVWLRGGWYLMENSAITDVQNGGLTFVTGGGYTRSDVAQGYWSLLKNSILVGNTQPIGSNGFPDNTFASNAGPFTPRGITSCANNPNKTSFCASAVDGITFVNSNFGTNQRLFNIYDGPSSEYNNIYSDVHVTKVGSPGGCNTGTCFGLGFMSAYVQGVIQSPPTGKPTNTCILPNAAIAWKQPNGFYYPPAFSSDHLVFSGVDIRHFVIQPLYVPYQPDYFTEDSTAIKNTYCSWATGMFRNSFTDIDRETELTDDDGTLTGLTSEDTHQTPSAGPSISVTKALFNNAPVLTDECASGQLPPSEPIASGTGEATVDTSPYEYLTTAVVAECALRGGNCGGNWSGNRCSDPTCYGVPLYRQYLTPAELQDFRSDNTHRPSIRMMGQASAQRSALTLNHATYYIDTSVPLDTQKSSSSFFNAFQGDGVYDFFLVFANNRTKQAYSLYIGRDLTQEQAKAVITPGRMQIPSNDFPFCTTEGDNSECKCGPQCTGSWATFGGYESSTGLLTINIDLSQQSDLEVANRKPFCQPTTYCSWNSETSTCGCKAGSSCTDDKVCSYGTKDIDCPVGGCYGFRIKLPGGFVAAQQQPPTPILFTDGDPYFQKGTVTFDAANAATAGACHYSSVPTQPAATSLERPSPLRLNQ